MPFWPGDTEGEQFLLALQHIPSVCTSLCIDANRELISSFGDIQDTAALCCKHPGGNRRQIQPRARVQAERDVPRSAAEDCGAN